MRLLQITLLLLIVALHAAAQEDYSEYTYRKEVIYSATFDKVDSNNAGWECDFNSTSLFQAHISDGNLVATNKNDLRVTATSFTFMFDYTRDFEIDFVARVEKKKIMQKFAIIYWGRDTTNENYNGQYIYFHADGMYRMMYCTGVGQNPCDGERLKFPAQTKKDFIKYTIRKIKTDYYVFINGTHCRKFAYTPLHGQQLGFGVANNTEAYLKSIQISYLRSQ